MPGTSSQKKSPLSGSLRGTKPLGSSLPCTTPVTVTTRAAACAAGTPAPSAPQRRRQSGGTQPRLTRTVRLLFVCVGRVCCVLFCQFVVVPQAPLALMPPLPLPLLLLLLLLSAPLLTRRPPPSAR